MYKKSDYIETLMKNRIEKQNDNIRNKVNNACIEITNNFLSNNNQLNQ